MFSMGAYLSGVNDYSFLVKHKKVSNVAGFGIHKGCQFLASVTPQGYGRYCQLKSKAYWSEPKGFRANDAAPDFYKA